MPSFLVTRIYGLPSFTWLIFSNRSRTAALWTSLRVPNRTLWGVTGLTLGLLALAICLPWLARLVYFEPLVPGDLLLALALGWVSVFWFEAVKLSRRLSSR